MKLKPNDSVFFGFSEFEQFTSRLPAASTISAAQVSDYYDQLLNGPKFIYDQTMNAMTILRSSAAFDAINIGVRSADVGALGDVFRLIPALTPGDLLDGAIREAVLKGVALSLDAALDQVVTRIPIVGWIVDLGLAIYNIAKLTIEQVKADKNKPPPKHALIYDRPNDEAITDAIITDSKSPNWTSIFSPTSTATWTTKELSYLKGSGMPDGLAFEPSRNDLGHGCFPGLAEQFGYYQFSRKQRPGQKSTNEAGDVGRYWSGPASSFTSLHPSVVQASTVLWQRVLKFGSRMFSVDMVTIESRWKDYFGEGQALFERSTDKVLRDVLVETLSFTQLQQPYGCKPGHYFRPRYTKYNCGTLPDEYLTPWLGSEYRDPVSYSELIRYMRREVWEPQAKACLKTIICAYVHPNAPGLTSWNGQHVYQPKLRELHTDMRKLLLNRAAVFDVEPDLIPDAEYRSAVIQAQKSGSKDMVAPSAGDVSPEPFQVYGIAAVLPDPPPPDPPTGLEPGIPGGEIDGSGGSGGLLAILAGLGLWALSR